MPRLSIILGLAATLITSAAAQTTCVPNFSSSKVFVFVSGTWSASPVAAGTTIIPVDSSSVSFAVTQDSAQNYSFRTAGGSLAVSGTSGALTLQTTSDTDVLQKYKITCTDCNVFGNPATARGCQIRPSSTTSQCVTNFGTGQAVSAIGCSGFAPGQYWHFNAV